MEHLQARSTLIEAFAPSELDNSSIIDNLFGNEADRYRRTAGGVSPFHKTVRDPRSSQRGMETRVVR